MGERNATPYFRTRKKGGHYFNDPVVKNDTLSVCHVLLRTQKGVTKRYTPISGKMQAFSTDKLPVVKTAKLNSYFVKAKTASGEGVSPLSAECPHIYPIFAPYSLHIQARVISLSTEKGQLTERQERQNGGEPVRNL